MRNAMSGEFQLMSKTPDAPFIGLSSEDIEEFLPDLPDIGERDPNIFADMDDFAQRDPTRYALYRKGLVAEGYTTSPASHGPDPSSSVVPDVRRKSIHPSGLVYPQDIDWTAGWALIKDEAVDTPHIPDPQDASKGKHREGVTHSTPQPRPQIRLPVQPISCPASPPSLPAPVPVGAVAGVRGGLGGFKIRPTAKSASPLPKPDINNDHMNVDGTAAKQRDASVPIAPHPSQPGNLLIPSSSQLSSPTLDPVNDSQATSKDDKPSSSSLPDVVPSTFPDEQSQYPCHPTFRLQLGPPSDTEIAAFQAQLDELDVPALSKLLRDVLAEVTKDPKVGVVAGESTARFMARRWMFWHLVYMRKGDLVPDDVFSYIRDDYPTLDPGIEWSDFVADWGADDLGGMFYDTGIERFTDRHKANQGPVYEQLGDGGTLLSHLPQVVSSDAPIAALPNASGAAPSRNIFVILFEKVRQSNHAWHSSRWRRTPCWKAARPVSVTR